MIDTMRKPHEDDATTIAMKTNHWSLNAQREVVATMIAMMMTQHRQEDVATMIGMMSQHQLEDVATMIATLMNHTKKIGQREIGAMTGTMMSQREVVATTIGLKTTHMSNDDDRMMMSQLEEIVQRKDGATMTGMMMITMSLNAQREDVATMIA